MFHGVKINSLFHFFDQPKNVFISQFIPHWVVIFAFVSGVFLLVLDEYSFIHFLL